jgi:tetratricopeptide (TPR) repeat protein
MRKILFRIALTLLAQPALALNRQESYDRCHSMVPADRIVACTALIKMVNLDSDKMDAYYSRGQAYFLTGALDNAISDASEAIKLGSYYVQSYLARADAYEKKGQIAYANADRAQAVKIASENIAQEPTSGYGYTVRAWAYHSIGDDSKSAADATNAVKLAPNDLQTLAEAGDIFSELGRNDDAVKAYTNAIAVQPLARIYRDRGWIYHLQGLEGHAVRDLTRAVEMNPSDPYAYGMRGKVFETVGNRVAAIADYRKAAKLNSNYPAPKNALIRLGAAR